LLPNAAQEILAQAIVDRRQGGTIFLIPVVVDPNGTVSETDETNNGLTLTIQ
jgi:subtilase family serine protease